MTFLLLITLPFAIMFLSFYIIRIAGLHKALRSLSESDYWLEYPWKWTFEALMFFVGGSLMFTALYLRDNPIIILFISGVCIFGVGVFARFKKNMFVYTSHMVCAYVGFGALVLCIGFSFNQWVLMLIPAIAALIALRISKHSKEEVTTWNVEVFLIYSSFMTLYPIIVWEVLKTL